MTGLCVAARLAVAMMVVAAPAASGQSIFRCSSGSTTSLSDRPCEAVAKSTLRAIGPAPQYPSHDQTYAPSMGQAPEILPYLSPQCAELNDAVRTGPARGLKGQAMSELTVNYRKRCSEDEQVAQQKLGQAKSDERAQRHQAQAAQKAEQMRAKLSVEQCYEMLRILAAKRQRVAAMTPGEQRDMELFEVNYKARCKAD